MDTAVALLKAISRFCTCKYKLDGLLLSHSSSPLEGNFSNYTCMSHLEALFPKNISYPFKGDL